ncbi:MAG: hypothetical protein ACAI25_21345 [Planctomycetota bacterium]
MSADNLVKRFGLWVGSVFLGIVVIAIKGFFGGGSAGPPPVASFPGSVFGGGTAVTIEVELSDEGDIHCTFASGNGYDVNKPQYVRIEKKLPAGKHSWTVSMPKQVEVSSEVHIRPPHLKQGSKILLVVKRGDEEIGKDEITSDSGTLKPGHAFFAQVEIENAGG